MDIRSLFQLAWLARRVVVFKKTQFATRPVCGRKSATTALATAAIVAVVANLGLALAATFSLAVRDPIYADRAAKLTSVETRLPTGRGVVLMLGTSRTGNGFDATKAGDRLSKTLDCRVDAFNFGIPGSGPATHGIHLRRLLDAGHRPALLLLEVLPASVAEVPGDPLNALETRFLDGARFDASERGHLEAAGIPGEPLRKQWVKSMVLPWSVLRSQLVGRVAPSWVPAGLRCDESRTADSHGWNRIWEESLTPQSLAAGADRTRRDYTAILRGWRPSELATRALREAINLARGRGIPTRLVVMPEASWFRALHSPASAARFDRWIHLLAEETGCPLTDARAWLLDGSFADGHHLLPGGAAAFTNRLVDEVVAPALAAKRAAP